jgi:hypothetical protein
VPAGRYQSIRLLIEAQQNQPSSYIDFASGARYPLYVPSGSESGLKLIRGFTVAAGSNSNFTIDFDLRKSVIAPPGQAPKLSTETGIAHGRQPAGRHDCRDGGLCAHHFRLLATGLYLHGCGRGT